MEWHPKPSSKLPRIGFLAHWLQVEPERWISSVEDKTDIKKSIFKALCPLAK